MADARTTASDLVVVAEDADARVTASDLVVVAEDADVRVTASDIVVFTEGAPTLARTTYAGIIVLADPQIDREVSDSVATSDSVAIIHHTSRPSADSVSVADLVTIILTKIEGMSIQDTAGNPLITQSSPMIGFIPLADQLDGLRLRIYYFIIEGIRQEDQQNGQKFLERYLNGPETLWAAFHDAITNVTALWDVASIPDELLQYLKRIVGWTTELDVITDPLDALTLRRLIAASVPFWKRRGPEDAMVSILRLVTGARVRVWNWFDYRIILDETAFGEDWNGFDPWMISLPGPPNLDEYRSNVRIVDDGTLDHDAVVNLVKLCRPAGERVEISYIGFMDLFTVNDDNSQWDNEPDPFAQGGSASQSIVDGGTFVVSASGASDSAEAFVSAEGSDSWNNYTVTWRIRGAAPVCVFYRTGNGDMYYVTVSVSSNELVLRKLVAGVPSLLAANVNMFATFGVILDADIYQAIRAEAVPEAGQTRIRVFWESELAFDVLDASHAQGSIGTGRAVGGGTSMELDEVELFFNPLETDTIDINS